MSLVWRHLSWGLFFPRHGNHIPTYNCRHSTHHRRHVHGTGCCRHGTHRRIHIHRHNIHTPLFLRHGHRKWYLRWCIGRIILQPTIRQRGGARRGGGGGAHGGH